MLPHNQTDPLLKFEDSGKLCLLPVRGGCRVGVTLGRAMRVLVLGMILGCSLRAGAVDFGRDVQPVLTKRCSACHGPQQQMKGLRVDDAVALLSVVVPGNSAGSKLFQRVSSTKKGFAMPPIGEPLTSGEIALIRDWIDQGAKIPAGAIARSANAKTSHWSFQPIKHARVPQVHDAAWVRNPIDNFVLARLEAEGIRPSQEADRNTLIRRLSLDLTGLPPSPEEVEAFNHDNHPDAYERLVDRLLTSPHYGEMRARGWLDLAHYADSDGYEKDLVRPWAWRYRQWVIEAFNRDMPYDEFTVEQLAGDLMPNATVEQRVATGFLRNTLTNREAGVDRTQARFEQIVNRTNTVATVWLGLTVGCAQCHNHKFDPITQKDYYQFFAFFNRADEIDIDAPLPGELGPYLEARPAYDKKRREILEQYHVPELQAQWEPRIQKAFREQGKDLEWDFAVTEMRASFDGADRFLKGEWAKRTERQAERLTDYFVSHLGPDLDKDKEKTSALKEARQKLRDLKATLPEIAQAQAMEESPNPPQSNIHLGGDYQALGAPVEPNIPSLFPQATLSPAPNRLALARWLVARDNPLTARVAVNRMWQDFFGRGLVHTSEDFGTQGDKPSHPELLDWLATEFQDHDWSMKYMRKLIVMSAAYRQSSAVRKELENRDPDNVLIARQARLRLPAESIRDEALAASGLLNTAIGGKSVRPPQPAGVAELGYADNVKWPESKGPDRYRRGLYIHFQRTTPYPMLMNFDEPDSNTTCTRRNRSNTPLQALNLLNDPVFMEAAQALTTRVLEETAGGLPQRIDYAFELCLSRRPHARERERLIEYYEQQKQLLAKNPKAAEGMQPFRPEGVEAPDAAAWVGVSRVLLNLDEFITRE